MNYPKQVVSLTFKNTRGVVGGKTMTVIRTVYCQDNKPFIKYNKHHVPVVRSHNVDYDWHGRIYF